MIVAAVVDLLFAYGSLAAEAGEPGELRGWRRVWGVAMDNARTIPGYKVYCAPDGSQPEVCVAFLDIEAHAGSVVQGVLLPVFPARLPALDRRERNYERRDVTAGVDGAAGRVWAYVGHAESRARLRAAQGAGRAVIAADYARVVAPLAEPGLPVLELRRVDVPESTRGRGEG